MQSISAKYGWIDVAWIFLQQVPVADDGINCLSIDLSLKNTKNLFTAFSSGIIKVL